MRYVFEGSSSETCRSRRLTDSTRQRHQSTTRGLYREIETVSIPHRRPLTYRHNVRCYASLCAEVNLHASLTSVKGTGLAIKRHSSSHIRVVSRESQPYVTSLWTVPGLQRLLCILIAVCVRCFNTQEVSRYWRLITVERCTYCV